MGNEAHHSRLAKEEREAYTKLGDGCFIISIENLTTVTKILNQFNVRFKTLTTYTS